MGSSHLGPHLVFASPGLYRDAAYFRLFFLYLSDAVVFQLSLPRKSLGKVAIVTGFVIWALSFSPTPGSPTIPGTIDIAAQIWDMQKFLVTIGMLLVMLERRSPATSGTPSTTTSPASPTAVSSKTASPPPSSSLSATTPAPPC